MRTIKKVNIIPVFVDLIPEKMKQGEVYISDKYKCSVHLCLCGCGMQTVLPLGENGWTVSKTEKGVSFTPSVGNFQYLCKSHYIITNNVANFV
jgi:hypothetical protein